ncbi:MAG: hypothetical protein WBM17_04445 [Anaerolineales bacterium]
MFKGFVCESTREAISPADCLQCARGGALPNCPMTAPVIAGIVAGLRPDDFEVTVTTLLGCLRKHRLKSPEDYWLRPGESWWAYRGQLMHSISAQYARNDPNALAEQRYSMLIETPNGGVQISGQPDLVLLDRGHIVDYKTTKCVPRSWKTYTCPETGALIREGTWAARGKIDCPHCDKGVHDGRTIVKESPPRAYASHRIQVSCYAALMYENGVEVNSGEIVYQDMSEQLRIRVDMMPVNDCFALMAERASIAMDPVLPDIIRDVDSAWECDYCPVRNACERIHGGPVGKGALIVEEAIAAQPA